MEIFLKLINSITVIPLTKNIYSGASDIYVKLQKEGFPTGEFDLLIAATALENKLKIVTNNTKHYIKIEEYFNLKIDNWLS